MDVNWESKFRSWAKPPGETEQTKCNNAERAIRNAVNAFRTFIDKSIVCFPQGSYRNRTNVKTESDVDICALCKDVFLYTLPKGIQLEDFKIIPATYSYAKYKQDIEYALVSYFGQRYVKRGNKAFDIHENTYRVDSDVVACFEYRSYYQDGKYIEGTAFIPDRGFRIVNWPQQNYDNGVKKNEQTRSRFKAIVRVLKNLRNEMKNQGIIIADSVPSHLIESLAWNVPNNGFSHATYTADVRWVLAHLSNNTRSFADCKEWGEINELKYLFRTLQSWTFEQTNSFLNAAWNYVGFR